MCWPDWAVEGCVSYLDTWGKTDIPDGSAIICRNNAPLFSVGIRLLKAGRSIKIVGNDIGANLIKVLTKLGPGDTPQSQVHGLISAWEKESIRKAHKARQGAIHDKADCLRVFAEAGQTLDQAIAYAKALFESQGTILLMTGHKSKGGEWPVVFHLDSWLVPSKWAIRAAEEGDSAQLIQEKNLKYVIESRAMESLYFINSEDYR